MADRHILGISGGKDSAALAGYMRDNYPELDIEDFFTDTGKELPEVYDFLGRLEGYLGKEIKVLNQLRDFDYWLKMYNSFLPSPQTRWCTRMMKLLPLKEYIQGMLDQGDEVYSYSSRRGA